MRKYLSIRNLIMLIVSVFAIIFVYNDYFLYKTPIMKINNIEESIENYGSNGEKYYNQKITGVIKNTKSKGLQVTVNNVTSTSGVYDEKIGYHSEVFLKNSNNTLSIVGIKRDKYIVWLIIIIIDLIILVAGKQGFKTLLSLIINIIISALAIFVFQSNAERLNLLILYLFVSIIFIILSLYITNGKDKKTFSAIISSIASLFISFGLSYLIINLHGRDITIWTMNYIEYVRDYENYFYVCILLSGLGAIMDISITMASSLNELIVKNPKITKKALLKSGTEISKDVVGTMSSVMLYTCFTPTIPLIFLAIKNNMALATAINYYGEIELITVLCSCISIVLAIPISLYISTFILKGGKND